MKKSIFTLFLIGMTSIFLNAQDLIVLKNAQEIEAKVTAVSQNDISYYKWNNLDGPLYTVSKSEVFFIKYQNGEKEVISESTNPSTGRRSGNVTSVSSKLNPVRAGRVTFDGYLNFSAYGNSKYAGPACELSLGVNLFDYGYIGLQSGFEYLFGYVYGYSNGYLIPIGLNMRGYLPCNGRIYPFLDWTIGASVGKNTIFHNTIMVGCDFSRFSLGLGWDYQGGANLACLKLGIRLGRIK